MTAVATCLQDTNAKERGEFPDTSSFQTIYDKLRSIRDEDGMSWCSNCHVVWDAIFPESERFDMGILCFVSMHARGG